MTSLLSHQQRSNGNNDLDIERDFFWSARRVSFFDAFHSAWNFAEGPLFGTNVSGIVGTNVVLGSQSVDVYPLLNGGNFGIEASLLTFIGGILLIACIYYLGQNYAKKSNRIEKII